MGAVYCCEEAVLCPRKEAVCHHWAALFSLSKKAAAVHSLLLRPPRQYHSQHQKHLRLHRPRVHQNHLRESRGIYWHYFGCCSKVVARDVQEVAHAQQVSMVSELQPQCWKYRAKPVTRGLPNIVGWGNLWKLNISYFILICWILFDLSSAVVSMDCWHREIIRVLYVAEATYRQCIG